MYKTAVFVSGRGSNLKSILNHFPSGNGEVEVSIVISNKPDCPAVDLASDNSIPFFAVSRNKLEGFVTFEELTSILIESDIQLIILAGYMKKIPDVLIESFQNRIINIHPALLPSFGGKGMYGMNVHTAVFEKSCQVSGPTVHFVDKIYDNGKIIAQKAVDISLVNSPEDIAGLVLQEEHKILPYVIKKFSEGKVKIENNRVYIKD